MFGGLLYFFAYCYAIISQFGAFITKKMYLCKLIMQKLFNILTLSIAFAAVSCVYSGDADEGNATADVVATVDNHVLLRSDIARDMPSGLQGADSVTFARMYVDNWVLSKLKMCRAEQVLSSYQKDIERLVEGYRQSLVMRQLDQYYIDRAIDVEISDKQLAAYYRANSASFKLDHHKVRGVVVKAPRSFRNTSTLSSTLKRVIKSGDSEEIRALVEKHNLQLSDYVSTWVSYSDFLSNLPTERSRTYTDLLAKSGVQQMSSDDMVFYFVITKVARKGEVAPLECVEDDIRRRLYAERRANIVKQYEMELRREGVNSGRVTMVDSVLLESMGFVPESVESVDDIAAKEETPEEDMSMEDISSENVE